MRVDSAEWFDVDQDLRVQETCFRVSLVDISRQMWVKLIRAWRG